MDPTQLTIVAVVAVALVFLAAFGIFIFAVYQMGQRQTRSAAETAALVQSLSQSQGQTNTQVGALAERLTLDIPNTLQGIVQALQQSQTQMAALSERVAPVEPLTRFVGGLQTEIRGVSERVSTVEQSQKSVFQGVSYLANNTLSSFAELKTLTVGLNDAAQALRGDVTKTKQQLGELQTFVRQSQDTEFRISESIRRLEMVIAGTQSKGMAGENILEVVFAQLPIEWQVRDFKVGGRAVEFGLKLPNNLIVPIDSKWTSTSLVEQLLGAAEVAEQQRIRKSIEDEVIQKAKEVTKYIDPSLTVNFGVAVIPDAVYDLCTGILVDAYRLNVILISYSMFVPYLLLVFQTSLRASQAIDLQKLDAYIDTIQSNISGLQEELDGRFSRALTMLGNSRDDMRAHLGKMAGSVAGLQLEQAVPTIGELGEQ